MKKILTIGNATLDIIVAMDCYPVEDEKYRALGQRIQRGGNASNSSEVLANLGHQVSLLVPFADDDASQTIQHSLQYAGVDMSYCVSHRDTISPTSYIITNESSKTRTIIHSRELAELSVSEFNVVPWQDFDVLHFEGRNIAIVKQMLINVQQASSGVKVSLEIEKQRPDIESLIQYADLVVFSNSYFESMNCVDMDAFFTKMRAYSNTAIFICSRGSQGAYGQLPEVGIAHSPAFIFGELLDTVGAGDTFNAGLIASYSEDLPIEQMLKNACLLASKKVTQEGFLGLNSFDLEPLSELSV